MTQLLQELAGDADDLVDGLYHMHRDADGAGLVRDGPGDGLADPPGSIGGEFVTLGVIELFHRLDKAQIALLDQVQELHTPAHIALGDGYHQTEVGLGQALFGGLVALQHTLGQLDLLVRRQQVHLADLLQIHAHRIVNGKTVHRNGLVDLILGDFFHVAEVFLVEILLQRVLLHGDLHAHLFQRSVELVLLVSVQFQGVDGLVDLLHGDPTVFLAELQQIVQHLLLVHRFVFLFCHVASSFIPACAVWPPKGVPDHPPARFVSDNDIGSYRSGHAIPLFAAVCPPAGPK